MKRWFLFLLSALLLVLLTASVSADQDGYINWCNMDEYGCWVTDENGGQCYIMFWSEDARAFFMGSHSRPGELVVERPVGDSGRLGLIGACQGQINYKAPLIALIEKCGETLAGELEYYKTHDICISKEEYQYSVIFYKGHGCSL